MRWKEMTLTGWGGTTEALAEVARPERARELQALVGTAHENGIIAHGRGRSYGDQALNSAGQVLLTQRLNRFLEFDPESGLVTTEPGVTFADLMRVLLPKGRLFPTTPGTAEVTVGGAVANDIHGKNHDRAGSFGDAVAWLDLVLASGEVVRCSPELRPELFRATIGGGGLTGIISRLCFETVAVASATIELREQRMGDLGEFLAAFAERRDRAEFSVGWIDGLAKGAALGRGILETGEFADAGGFELPPWPRRRVPVALPTVLLNPLSVRLFNHYYMRRIPPQGRERRLPLDRFFHPLDAIADWNRIYGRRGFHQFQCVIPEAEAEAGIQRLMEIIAASGQASPLAVLKTLGGPGRGYLSFPLRGYTLALDFPRRARTAELLSGLEKTTLEHGGRVYLAKDSLMSAAGFEAMYPELPAFRQVLAEVDPGQRFQSDLGRRLGLRGGSR